MTLIERGELMRARRARRARLRRPAGTRRHHGLACRRAGAPGEATLGRHERALADYRLCAGIAEAFQISSPVLAVWESAAALSLHALGRDGEALQQAAAGVARARAFGGPRALGMALTVQGRLAASQARLEHARALGALGAEQRRRGQRAAAREQLGRALALARDCDALALAARACKELKAAGAHPRRILRHGADSLTAAERRVAVLAADGLSNAEIARALSLSVRTVESHLAHVYRKLAIQGRRQLSLALAHEHPRAAVGGAHRPCCP